MPPAKDPADFKKLCAEMAAANKAVDDATARETEAIAAVEQARIDRHQASTARDQTKARLDQYVLDQVNKK